MDFDNVVIKDSPGLCRCCLSEGCYKDLGSEYIWMGEPEIYAEMLLECFDINISQHNNGPNGPNRLICEVCITRLRDACNFKKQVMDSERKFVDMLARGDFIAKVSNNAPMKAETSEAEAIEEDHIEVEYLENDMEYDYEDIKEEDSDGEIKEKPARASATSTRKAREEPKRKKTQTESKQRVRKTTKKGGIQIGGSLHNELKLIRNKKRQNMEYVLRYSTATPFMYQHGKYRCFYCLAVFLDPDLLREHTWENHENEDIKLTIFKRSDKSKEVPFKIDITNISCKLCSEPMENLDDFILHLITIHDAQYHNVSNCFLQFRLIKDRPTCGVCNEQFDFFLTLLQHANKEHLFYHYVCDVCGVGSPTKIHLQWHVNTYHKEGGYGCRICDLKFSTPNKRHLHERNVHHAYLSSCPHCSQKFKSPYFKKIHLASVHGIGELKFKCPHCPQSCALKSTMLRHMRTVHLKVKNVECKICGNKFFGPYNLKLHMAKHTGEKKHICSVCGKKYTKKTTLAAHEVTHSGQKGYACELCCKGYGQYAKLKLHVKNKHPEYEIVEEQTIEYEEISGDQFMTMVDDGILSGE